MRNLARLYRTLVWLTLIAALAAPVVAQPDPDINYTGPVSVVQGGTLVDSISSALAESNQQLGDELETSLGTALDSAITEAADQLTAGGTVGGLFQSPAFLASIFALVNAVIVFLTTNSIKLSTLLRGKPTLLLAVVLSAITSGLGVYFGPGGGEGTPERIALAVAAALGTLGGAVGIHETSQALKTGMRKPERKRAARERTVSDVATEVLEGPIGNLAKQGLIALATSFGLPYAGILVDSLLSENTVEKAEAIIRDMGKKRALSQVEIEADQDKWKGENPITAEETAAARRKLEARGGRVLPTESAATQPIPPANDV